MNHRATVITILSVFLVAAPAIFLWLPARARADTAAERAIRLVETGVVDGRQTFRPEILAGCVGCGVCEMICPTEPGVIEMDDTGRGVNA